MPLVVISLLAGGKIISVTLEQLAKELEIPETELLNRGFIAYLEHELRLAEEDIADLRDKYLILNKGDLEKHVKDKSIPEHPAWEDLITWENTEEYIQKLKNLLSKIK